MNRNIAWVTIGVMAWACEGQVDMGTIGQAAVDSRGDTDAGSRAGDGAATMPASPGIDDAAAPPASCIENGITHAKGTTWACLDACNECFCDNPPDVPQTTIGCLGGVGATAPPTPACWSNQVPEVQPILPSTSVEAVCSGTASGPVPWAFPPDAGYSDSKFEFVGRWISCTPGGGDFGSVPHDGVEFGANGRWRLLVRDSAGSLVSTTSTSPGMLGYYYAVGDGSVRFPGSLDIRSETEGDSSDPLNPVFSAAGDGVSFSGHGVYARIAPSPMNGRDNVPSTTDGACSMAGTWDVPTDTVGPVAAPAATFSFDSLGNFVGGPAGTDLCASHTIYGTYRLTPGLFQLTQNVGMGACIFCGFAGYVATFDSTCTQLTLSNLGKWDNCTGARGYFNNPTTLTKRP